MSIARDDGPAGAGTGLSAAQKRALLARLMAEGKGRAVAPAEGFGPLFERQAGLTPDAVAVSHGGAGLTYGALNARAAQWADALRGQGARPGDVVGLAFARGPALVAGLIGILKTGCAFLPLEPGDAPARLDRLRASVRFVLTQEGAAEARLVEVSLAEAGTAADPSAFARIAPERALLAVPERAVAERLAWLRAAFPLTGADVSLCTASLHDISAVTSLFWPLTMGATVALAPVEREPAALATLAHATGATCALLPPAALPLLDETALRLVFLDGDPPPGMAGPAGAHAFTLWQVGEAGGPVLAQPVGEGAPLLGAPLRILDRHGTPVPLGGVGSLAVTPATGLSEVTPGARARQRADGRFERRPDGGRRVQAGGLRFGLAAVEAELRGQAGIADCRVLERMDTAGAPRLVAYVVPDGHATPQDWAPHAERVLPIWQRPAAFVAVAALPLTEAGAVDDAALARLPVPDGFAAAQWRELLERMDGVAEAAVVTRALAPEPAFVTLPPVAPLPPPATVVPEPPPGSEGPWALARAKGHTQVMALLERSGSASPPPPAAPQAQDWPETPPGTETQTPERVVRAYILAMEAWERKGVARHAASASASASAAAPEFWAEQLDIVAKYCTSKPRAYAHSSFGTPTHHSAQDLLLSVTQQSASRMELIVLRASESMAYEHRFSVHRKAGQWRIDSLARRLHGTQKWERDIL